MKTLSAEYFLSDDVVFLAKDLLGKVIISNIEGETTTARIVETEAYRAPEDRASHAFGNKRTNRTEVMFANGGLSYIYLCYGIHHLFNVVTGPKDVAHAVLIRAVEPIAGENIINQRRKLTGSRYNLTNGPGKWTMAMGITKKHNAIPLHKPDGTIRICQDIRYTQPDIIASERVGIAYARDCAHWPWRFRIKDNPWTSKPNKVIYNRT